jgi:hypothetical protein
MTRLVKFLQISGMERCLFIEAALWLGIIRLSLLIIPFRWITPFLGSHMAQPLEKVPLINKDLVNRVSWAIHAAGRHLPWKCKCMDKAVAGKAMLNRLGVPSTLYLGVAKDADKSLRAHAWLQTGGVFVSGGQGSVQYTVVSTFSEEKS